MHFRADIAVLNQQGGPTVLFEAKSKVGTTPDWAAAMRRNLAAHGLATPALYFVLATPDRFYFWLNKTMSVDPVPPDFSFDPTTALEPYYSRARIRPGEMGEDSFELVLASWLGELIQGSGAERLPTEVLEWMQRSGFLAAIQGGRLQQN